MTYSVGFRAPSTRDLVAFFGDHVASTVTKADAFYRDPDLERQESHGEGVVEAGGKGRESRDDFLFRGCVTCFLPHAAGSRFSWVDDATSRKSSAAGFSARLAFVGAVEVIM